MENRIKLPPLPPTSPPSPFVSLPPELKQTIFSALPDANSLKSLILTCSSFYHAFRDAESLVITSVLHNQVGSALMYDAFIVLKCTTVRPNDHDAAIDILNLYVKRDFASLTPKWKLSDALAIGRLHDAIEFFSDDFASLALSTNPVTGHDELSPSALSVLESRRIKRSFYIFEHFSKLYRILTADEVIGNMAHAVLAELCTPWQHEQLACVRDYLFDRLSLPYNDVAEHDVEWGKLGTHYLYRPQQADRQKEQYLSLGLSFLHRLVLTTEYDDRCHLLKTCKPVPGSKFFNASLFDLMRRFAPTKYGLQREVEQLVHIPAPLLLDDDDGPEEAWRWAQTFGNARSAGSWDTICEQRTLRQRGYVMWDFTRLARWDILSYDWDDLPREDVRIGIYFEERHRQIDMQSSFEARSKIWHRGGRGWWSVGDESRLIWPPGGPIEIPKESLKKVLGYCWD